ncbi:MAG: hypothetical protein V4682_03620 [Patescibacteria group bacterium]
MELELTNLLPEERIRSLRRVYFIRLAVVAVLLLSGVTLVHGVLLLPSFMYLRNQVGERTASLAALTTTLAGSEEKEISARVATLAEDSAHLARLSSVPKASAAIRAISALPRSGIRLTGFSFAPKEGAEAEMSVSGVATTREALRTFEQSLADQPFITSADLPISAYAKERDISFTISLIGPFTL